MQAKALTSYPINAFAGRELVRYEWRPVPVGCEAEAERLQAAGLVELKRGGQQIAIEPLQLAEPVELAPPTLAIDLDALTIIQLKDMARDQGIAIGRKSKAELIDALRND